jgi:mannose-1-phosphate guanylyltransferase/mannose-6-phosphate isomerase
MANGHSSFQDTVARVSDRNRFELPIILTGEDYRFVVRRQLNAMGAEATILIEPEPRDSGPAMLAAALWDRARHPEPRILLFLASDHSIETSAQFAETCMDGLHAAATGRIVTFGIVPTEPLTRYGYIAPGTKINGQAKQVDAFVEKPARAVAEDYIAQGYLWNSGNFLCRSDVLISEYEHRAPQTVASVKAAVSLAKHDLDFTRLDAPAFATAEKKSIDYAVMEGSKLAAVVAAKFSWSDVGTWDSVWRDAKRDGAGNAFLADTHAIEAEGCLTMSDRQLVTLVGVRDLVVVATRDAVLVANRSETDKVKALVTEMKAADRSEAENHQKCYRPWGWYETLELGSRFQVKRIVVYSGERLSLQKHFHRAEHWVVVRGTALVTNGEEKILLKENESTFIPLGHLHRLENPGKIDLELIEVQSGSYLGEDDIVRVEDIYARS